MGIPAVKRFEFKARNIDVDRAIAPEHKGIEAFTPTELQIVDIESDDVVSFPAKHAICAGAPFEDVRAVPAKQHVITRATIKQHVHGASGIKRVGSRTSGHRFHAGCGKVDRHARIIDDADCVVTAPAVDHVVAIDDEQIVSRSAREVVCTIVTNQHVATAAAMQRIVAAIASKKKASGNFRRCNKCVAPLRSGQAGNIWRNRDSPVGTTLEKRECLAVLLGEPTDAIARACRNADQVESEGHVGGLPQRTIRPRECRDGEGRVFAGQRIANRSWDSSDQIYLSDTSRRQRLQFPFVRNAVLVQISPDSEICEPSVTRVQDSISVGIERLAKRLEITFGVRRVVGEDELPRLIDDPISVEIDRQNAIIG